MDKYEEVRLCGHCNKPTMHYCEDTGKQMCQKCGWYACDPYDTYHEPEADN